ncbi:DUF6443 domain-containing protein [Spongiimicrobium salis]|uniref:DUF6443 domain-containing protein n=1 Tax=Spongiimicrobium salis TaxID=1667022 RepID=UPI00374CBC24
MKNNTIKTHKIAFFIGILFLFLMNAHTVYGQFGGGGGGSISINGATVATAGETKTYSISGPSNLTNTTWTVSSGAQVLSSSTYSATVRFNNTGTASVSAISSDPFFGLYNATVYVTVSANPPPNPANPTLASTSCGTGTLSRSGNPPSGVTWYWQGRDANGTFTHKGSGSSFTANEGSGYYYIRARNSSGLWSSGTGRVYATLRDLNAGIIGSSHTICYSGDPNTLSSVNNASYGNGYSYQWQYSSNGSSGWTNISGATGASYNPPGGLTTSRWYRRQVSSCGITRSTSSIKVTVLPNLNAGSIAGTQTVCYSGDPATLGSNSNANGGNGSYSYQWQYSNNGSSSWTNISGATGTSYNPPSGQTSTRWYRRRAISCSQTKYTSSIKVTVQPNLSAGSISGTQTVCYSGDPSTLGSSSNASGGNGSFGYQWQYSNNGSNGWTNISGATSTSYNPPGGLTASRWYRRRASSCSQTKYTGSIQVTVNPSLNAGSISGIQTVCYAGDPSTLGSSSNASGGNGSYSYQWQYSNNGSSSWTNISGATGTSYNPPSGLAASRWYRRRAISCSETKYTSSVQVSVAATPAVPPLPSITNNCGNTVLTRTAPPSGISWYWQSTATGTSTSNANTSITRTSGSVYYLRGRNSNGCWGTAQTITYSITQPSTWYVDADGDGYGNSATSSSSCTPPAGYVSNSDDYDDSTANITNIPPQNFYSDSDNDGYGDPAVSVYYSVAPTGYVANNADECPAVAGPGTGNGCYQPVYDAVSLDNNQNYIYSRAPQKAMSSIDNNALLLNADIIDQVAYFDGLGRGLQQIAIKQSPTGKDIVTHMEYDALGRQTKEYLPYPTTDVVYGQYKTGDQDLATKQYYKTAYADDFTGVTAASTNTYSETLFEASPLNRPLKQAAPGKDWELGSGHEVKFEYSANTTGEVTFFEVSFTGGDAQAPTLIDHGSYHPGELTKVITKDENHDGSSSKDHTTEEFTNTKGQVVLKRTYDNEIPHDTYYVYDDYSNLSFVLPPKVDISNGVSATELSELAYQYKYDYRNRLIEKKIPGKGWEYIVYNKRNQPIMTQDPNLRAQGEWLFTKYDAFGRVVYTGITSNNGSRTAVQTAANGVSTQFETKGTTAIQLAGTDVYYSNSSYPTAFTQTLSINYYDNTTFDKDGLSLPATTSFGQAMTSQTKELATGSKVRVLGTTNWITTLTGYDAKGRPIYVASKNNELGTTDIVESKLDFVGKVLETKSTHTKGSNASIVVTEKFTYDHAARLVTQTHQIGNGTVELIAENVYDEIGQLVTKNVGNTTSSPLQEVNYAYNVRGWLKKINDISALGTDLFGFELKYNDPTSGTPLYNGNISQTHWKTANTDSSLKSYTYAYDALNRIKSGVDNTGHYNLSSIAYDKNGNITTLNRKGHLVASPNPTTSTHWGTMDALSYSYDSGNKLTKVVDNANDTYGFKDGTNTNDDFEYDANGNMILDRNKGITDIDYNHLNLPTKVSFGTNKDIRYSYDAAGIKIKKIVNDSGALTTTEYAGNYIYENGGLQFFNTAEGYVEADGTNDYDYTYQYKDHLGNIRLSYSDNNHDGNITTSEIKEENNFYPFGLKHKGYNNGQNGRDHTFEYNGMELEESLGYNMMEMEVRQFDPAIARWVVQDPVVHYNYSPFNAFDNNPIYWADPSGANSQSDVFGRSVTDGRGNHLRPSERGAADSNDEDNCCGDEEESGESIGAKIRGVINSAKSFLGLKSIKEEQILAENGKVKEAQRIKKLRKKTKKEQTKALGSMVNLLDDLDVLGVSYTARLLAAMSTDGGFEDFYESINNTLGTNHTISGDALGSGLSLLGVITLGGNGLVGKSSASSFWTVGSIPTQIISKSEVVIYGQKRLILRGANGRFVKGSSKIITESQSHQLNGFNGLGQATFSTPWNYSKFSNVPGWAKWSIAVGGSGAINYWTYRKLTEK